MNLESYLLSFDDNYEAIIEYWVYSSIADGYKVLAKKPTAQDAYQWARDYLANRYGSYDFQHDLFSDDGFAQLTHRLSPQVKEWKVDVVINPVKVK